MKSRSSILSHQKGIIQGRSQKKIMLSNTVRVILLRGAAWWLKKFSAFKICNPKLQAFHATLERPSQTWNSPTCPHVLLNLVIQTDPTQFNRRIYSINSLERSSEFPCKAQPHTHSPSSSTITTIITPPPPVIHNYNINLSRGGNVCSYRQTH